MQKDRKPVTDDWMDNTNGGIKGQSYEYYLELESSEWNDALEGTVTRWYIRLNDVRDRFFDEYDKRIAYLTYTLTPEKQEWSVIMRKPNTSSDGRPVWGARFSTKGDACLYAIMLFNRSKVYGITAYEIKSPLGSIKTFHEAKKGAKTNKASVKSWLDEDDSGW